MTEVVKPEITYVFSKEIDEESALETVLELENWAERPDAKALTFVINSPGGDLDEAVMLHETLRSLLRRGIPVTTEVRGYCASAAVMVLQAGERRLMGAYSRLMLHESSRDIHGANVSEMARLLKDHQDIWDLYCDCLTERSHLTVEVIKERCREGSWYIYPAEALELGLVDEVVY